jgi:DNA-binding transcriptional ArsR family regulator
MAESESERLLKVIDGEAYRLLEDDTRRRIIFLLRDNELTVKEVASKLELTPQNIYHHVRKLQQAGLIRVLEERRAGHLIESYYTTTADTFMYVDDEIEELVAQSFIDVLHGLNDLGIQVEVNEENADRLSEMYLRRNKLLNPRLLNRIFQYSRLVKMTDEEFEESLEQTRELRRYLISISNQIREEDSQD